MTTMDKAKRPEKVDGYYDRKDIDENKSTVFQNPKNRKFVNHITATNGAEFKTRGQLDGTRGTFGKNVNVANNKGLKNLGYDEAEDY